MYTRSTTSEEAIADRKWWIIDVADQPVGRVASKIATILRGKHKPTYTPHMDDGDFIVAINADKIKFTGNKWADKIYYRHTGYVGGIKAMTATELNDRHPTAVLEKAVKGMLPRGPLGRAQLKKLKVYTGVEHPHVAPQPESLTL
jgi:large subunit ribosomal protein L13